MLLFASGLRRNELVYEVRSPRRSFDVGISCRFTVACWRRATSSDGPNAALPKGPSSFWLRMLAK